jgi:hypothetical protein
MPVLPLVASITVWPGVSEPWRPAAARPPPPRLCVSAPLERFELDEELHVRRRDVVDAHDRRVADEIEY